MARLRIAALIMALVAAGCAPGAQDAAIPVGMADEVESARLSLRQNEEGPARSSFSFRAVRCRADGGLLLIFERASIAGRSLAFAMQGPGAAPDGWAGGFGVDDLEADSEVVHFFSEAPEVPCP